MFIFLFDVGCSITMQNITPLPGCHGVFYPRNPRISRCQSEGSGSRLGHGPDTLCLADFRLARWNERRHNHFAMGDWGDWRLNFCELESYVLRPPSP
jgi:hypothetical protein